jgi:hypothetical protein
MYNGFWGSFLQYDQWRHGEYCCLFLRAPKMLLTAHYMCSTVYSITLLLPVGIFLVSARILFDLLVFDVPNLRGYLGYKVPVVGD